MTSRTDNALNQFLTEHFAKPKPAPEPAKPDMSFIDMINEALRKAGPQALVGQRIKIKLPSASWRQFS